MNLAVLEIARWYPRSEISVRELFDAIRKVNHRGSRFDFRTFDSKQQFMKGVRKFAAKSSINYLYVGAHGGSAGIEVGRRQRVDAKQLRELILPRRKGGRAGFLGVYVSVCGFLTERNARRLLAGGQGNRLVWACGYRKGVDWLWGLMFDGLFFSTYLWERYKHKNWTERRILERTVATVRQKYLGLAQHLGFRAFVRKRGNPAEIVNIV